MTNHDNDNNITSTSTSKNNTQIKPLPSQDEYNHEDQKWKNDTSIGNNDNGADNDERCTTKSPSIDTEISTSNQNSKDGADDNEEEYEEDWSMYMQNNTSTNNSDIPNKDGGGASYATHTDTVIIQLNNNNTTSNKNAIKLSCINSLTPLDMMDLYSGTNDATGNKIWMGALFFLQVFVRTLPPPPSSPSTEEENKGILKHLRDLRQICFHQKKVLELGCGTGIAGIGLFKSVEVKPLHVTMTDFDLGVLHLCLDNCLHNLIDDEKERLKISTCYAMMNGNDNDGNSLSSQSSSHFAVCPLSWNTNDQEDSMLSTPPPLSSTITTTTQSTNKNHHNLLLEPYSYDTVIATDVLYDISSLTPLFLTASKLLKHEGYFVLAHVPRASVVDADGNGMLGTADVLEDLICKEAMQHGFSCDDDNNKDGKVVFVRPKEIRSIWGDLTYQEMEDAGASIMIFLKGS